MSYRHPNKRVVHRGPGGKFRKSTLADVGMAECEKCHALFYPDFSDLGVMIDPRDFNERRRLCPDCGGKGEKTGLTVDQD